MILIPIDEGAAFDMLVILLTKLSRSGGDKHEKIRAEIDNLGFHINNQIKPGKYAEIANSDEYTKLYVYNEYIFELIDRLRSGDSTITAKQIDDANLDRYNAKVALQKKFFPDSPVMEQKFLKS